MAKLLSSLPVGSKVKDKSWNWEHKTGSSYTGSGAIKPVTWLVVAKNHTGYPANSVTLLSNELIASNKYDDRYNDISGYESGYSHWGESNIIRPFLNSTFYNAFSLSFKKQILDTVVRNVRYDGVSYNTTDKVFIPSWTEVVGNKLAKLNVTGSHWGYFSQEASPSKAAYLGGTAKNWWTRTEEIDSSYKVYNILTSGSGAAYNGSSDGGYRPVVNLKADTPVSDNPDTDGAYVILHNEPPTAPSSITVPTTVKGGETLAISWGASTDADGNLSGYILERSVNGGAFAQVYKGANRNFTDAITKGWNTVAYRVKAYDSNNAESGYRTSPTRDVINNTAPTISGSDSNLGDKNLGFVISYQVDDVDAGDNLVVTEKLNNTTLKTINGAPRKQNLEIEITNEMLFALALNSTNTIEIKVDDGQGGIAYRRFTFRRTNSAPIISDQDKDLGQKLEPFSIDFSVSDNEGNAITVKTYLNNVLKEEYQAEDGVLNTFNITKEDWYKLPIGQHSIKIEAIDEHGATAIRNYTFTRYDDKIQFTLKTPIETDIMATKILVTPTWTIPDGSIAIVEACNNGFDDIPTWEDITSQILISRHYNFTNTVKTAAKWGINIRFTIEKGTATEQVVINGFGGAFE